MRVKLEHGQHWPLLLIRLATQALSEAREKQGCLKVAESSRARLSHHSSVQE